MRKVNVHTKQFFRFALYQLEQQVPESISRSNTALEHQGVSVISQLSWRLLRSNRS